LQQGLELTNAFTQRLHDRIEACANAVPDLERGIAEFDCQVQELRANVQRTSDSLALDVSGSLEQLGSEVQDLKSAELTTSAGLVQLRSEFDENCHALQDTRQLLDKTRAESTNFKKGLDDICSREGQLGARLNDWKHQWTKLQPKLEAISKDTAHLKQVTDHQKESLCTLQQGYATSLNHIESLQNQQVQATFDLQEVQQSVSVTQRDVLDTREGLSRADQFASSLQTGMQKTDNELRRTASKMDGLETKHQSLCEVFEKTNGCVSDLSKEHRRSIASVQTLKQEIDKTNGSLSSARIQLEATESHLHGLKGEVGRTSEVVQRLDHGVEMCQASFAGLQKGFVETSSNISRRPSMLPKLSKDLMDSDLMRLDSATESTASRMSSRRSTMNMDVFCE